MQSFCLYICPAGCKGCGITRFITGVPRAVRDSDPLGRQPCSKTKASDTRWKLHPTLCQSRLPRHAVGPKPRICSFSRTASHSNGSYSFLWHQHSGAPDSLRPRPANGRPSSFSGAHAFGFCPTTNSPHHIRQLSQSPIGCESCGRISCDRLARLAMRYSGGFNL
jgi:hypothetical protein